MTSIASWIFWSGDMVIGLTIMPLSERFTLSTSSAWASMVRFLWMTPRPPCWASAMAIRESVTVSIAALRSGMFRGIFRVSRVEMSTSEGMTSLLSGCRSTSSNVSASLKFRSLTMAL